MQIDWRNPPRLEPGQVFGAPGGHYRVVLHAADGEVRYLAVRRTGRWQVLTAEQNGGCTGRCRAASFLRWLRDAWEATPEEAAEVQRAAVTENG